MHHHLVPEDDVEYQTPSPSAPVAPVASSPYFRRRRCVASLLAVALGTGAFVFWISPLSRRWLNSKTRSLIGFYTPNHEAIRGATDEFRTPHAPTEYEAAEHHWSIKKDFGPAVCAGHAVQAAFAMSAAGAAAAAAARECNSANYKPYNPYGGRRLLADLKRNLSELPSLQRLAGVLQDMPHEADDREMLDIRGLHHAFPQMDKGGSGQTAYNMTELDMYLKLNFSLDKSWTLEGWLYVYDGGVVWDMRENALNSSNTGLQAWILDNKSMALAARGVMASSGDSVVPINRWTHLAWQLNGSMLQFFIDGLPAGPSHQGVSFQDLGSQDRIQLAQSADNREEEKFRGLITNMRLSSAAVYAPGLVFVPEHELQLGQSTIFLLKNSFVDVVSGEQVGVRIAGQGQHERVDERHAIRMLATANFYWGGQPGLINNIETMPSLCARDILFIIKQVGAISTLVSGELAVCQNKSLVGQPCAVAVSAVVNFAGNVGRFLAPLGAVCPQKFREGYFSCARQLEGASWSFDGLGKSLENAARKCSDSSKLPPNPKNIHYGACVGEVASSAGYISSAGLYVDTAANVQCPSSFTPLERSKFEKLPYEERVPILARCGADSTAFARTMMLAANKAAKAGGACSGLHTFCAQNVLLAAAAFSNLAEEATLAHEFCFPGLEQCCTWDYNLNKLICTCNATQQQDANTHNAVMQAQCGQFSAGVAKSVGVVAAFIAESYEACQNDYTAKAGCASMIPYVMASWGFFAEYVTRLHVACSYSQVQNLYGCAVQMMIMGQALDQAAQSTAAAVINCGAAAAGDAYKFSAKRLVGLVQPHRRFFTP